MQCLRGHRVPGFAGSHSALLAAAGNRFAVSIKPAPNGDSFIFPAFWSPCLRKEKPLHCGNVHGRLTVFPAGNFPFPACSSRNIGQSTAIRLTLSICLAGAWFGAGISSSHQRAAAQGNCHADRSEASLYFARKMQRSLAALRMTLGMDSLSTSLERLLVLRDVFVQFGFRRPDVVESLRPLQAILPPELAV